MRDFEVFSWHLFFLTVSLQDNTYYVLMYHHCGKDNSANGYAGIPHWSADCSLGTGTWIDTTSSFFPNGHRLSQLWPVTYLSYKTSATAEENFGNGHSIHCFQPD